MRSDEGIRLPNEIRRQRHGRSVVAVAGAGLMLLVWLPLPAYAADLQHGSRPGSQGVLGAVQGIVTPDTVLQEAQGLQGRPGVAGTIAQPLAQGVQPYPYLYVCLGLLLSQGLILAGHGLVLGVQLHRAQRLLEEQRICERLQQSYRTATQELAREQYRIPQQIADAIAAATHHTPAKES